VLALQNSIAAAGVADDIGDARQLAGSFLMTEEAVTSYVRGARIITDDIAFFVPAIELETILASFKPYARVAPTRQ